jgi:hypothetical protein
VSWQTGRRKPDWLLRFPFILPHVPALSMLSRCNLPRITFNFCGVKVCWVWYQQGGKEGPDTDQKPPSCCGGASGTRTRGSCPSMPGHLGLYLCTYFGRQLISFWPQPRGKCTRPSTAIPPPPATRGPCAPSCNIRKITSHNANTTKAGSNCPLQAASTFSHAHGRIMIPALSPHFGSALGPLFTATRYFRWCFRIWRLTNAAGQ